MVHIMRISQFYHLSRPAPPPMDNITTSSPTAVPTPAYVPPTLSLTDVRLSDPDMMPYTLIAIGYLAFFYLVWRCFKCTKDSKPKKMRYVSKLTSQNWYAEFDVNKPWKARYKKNERFTFEPLFDPDEDKKVIAINGWTNSRKGNAYFVTQDRETFRMEVQRLQKHDIPSRSTIDAYWDGGSSNPYLTETDLNADEALEDVWDAYNHRFGCICGSNLNALFYVIQVMPTWCDTQQYEAMKEVVGMDTAASV